MLASVGWGAEVLKAVKKDKFFEGWLEQQPESLLVTPEREAKRPLSTAGAVDVVKQYLAESRYRIRLRDLVHEEVEAIYRELSV